MSKSNTYLAVIVLVSVCTQDPFAQRRIFEERPEVELGQSRDLSPSLTFVDGDGDSDLDVLVANGRHWTQLNEVTNRGTQNGIYLNLSNARFGSKRGFGTQRDSTITLAVADVNEDGYPDLILANRDGQGNAVYFNDPELGFSKSEPFGTGSDETRAVAVADMNRDGHPDIVTANIWRGEWRLFRGR